jgi:hypothetical protein
MVSDQGGQFTGALTKLLSKIYNIQWNLTTTYHPKSNGMVENMNKNLIRTLARLVSPTAENWDDMLPVALHAIRAMPNKSTGMSPFFLEHGRTMRMCSEMVFNPGLHKKTILRPDYTTRMARALSAAYTEAFRASVLATHRNREQALKKAKDRNWKNGDRCWLHRPQLESTAAHKFCHPLEGPYTIINARDNHTAIVKRNDNMDGKSLTVNFEHLVRVPEQMDSNFTFNGIFVERNGIKIPLTFENRKRTNNEHNLRDNV